MIYEANGRQYLVIMPGGHHFMETPGGMSSSLMRCRGNELGSSTPS